LIIFNNKIYYFDLIDQLFFETIVYNFYTNLLSNNQLNNQLNLIVW